MVGRPDAQGRLRRGRRRMKVCPVVTPRPPQGRVGSTCNHERPDHSIHEETPCPPRTSPRRSRLPSARPCRTRSSVPSPSTVTRHANASSTGSRGPSPKRTHRRWSAVSRSGGSPRSSPTRQAFHPEAAAYAEAILGRLTVAARITSSVMDVLEVPSALRTGP